MTPHPLKGAAALLLLFFLLLTSTVAGYRPYSASSIDINRIRTMGLMIIWEGQTAIGADFGYHITVPDIVDESLPEIEVVFDAYPRSIRYLVHGHALEISINHERQRLWKGQARLEFPGGFTDALSELIIEDLRDKGYRVTDLSDSLAGARKDEKTAIEIGKQQGLDAIYLLRYNAYSKFDIPKPKDSLTPYRTALGLLVKCEYSLYFVETGKRLVRKTVEVNSVQHLGLLSVKASSVKNGVIDEDLLVAPLILVLLKGSEKQGDPLHSDLPRVK